MNGIEKAGKINHLLQDCFSAVRAHRYDFWWHILWYVTLLLFSFPVSAKFQHLVDDDGYSHVDLVADTAQDSYGLLWFGGKLGLSRFDGTQYKQVLNAYIYDVAIQGDDVWVGTKAGIVIYNMRTETTRLYELHRELGARPITQILHKDNALILGTEKGVLYIRGTKIERWGRGEWVTSLRLDQHQRLWVGYANEGVDVISSGGRTLDTIDHCGRGITTLFQHINNDMYVGTRENGVCIVNADLTYQRHLLTGKPIRSIVKDLEANIWVGTDGAGIVKIDADGLEKKYRKNDQARYSLASDQVYDLFVDSRGDVIAALFPAGVQIYDRSLSAFTHIKHEPNNIHSLSDSAIITLLPRSNDVLVGTENGLNTYNYRTGENVRWSLPGQRKDVRYPILSLAEYNGALWVGTWSHGLYRYHYRTSKWTQYRSGDKSGLGDNFIWALYKDSQNTLWVGTENAGLAEYSEACDCFSHYTADDREGSLSFNFVRDILEDSQDRFWVATRSGLNVMDRQWKTFKRYPPDQYQLEKPGNQFFSLFEDRLGRVWMGTEDGGVGILDNETYVINVLNKDDGLPANTIAGFSEDENGSVWVSTISGLVRIDKRLGTQELFDQHSGISSALFNRAAMANIDHYLFAGSADGLNKIDLDLISKKDDFIPNLMLTSLSVNHQTLSVGDKLTPESIAFSSDLVLSALENVFTISYSVLGFRPSDRYRYSYRLLNHHDEWVTTSDTKVVFTNIQPGHYIFEVMAYNRSGQSTNIRKLNVTITPPFYATAVAYGLYFTIVLIFVILAILYLLKQQQLDGQKKIGEKLQRLDKIKDLFLANTSHELRAPVAGMVHVAESILPKIEDEDIKSQLNLISATGRRLNILINDILDYAKIQEHDITLDKQALVLSASIDKAFAILRYAAESAKISLINDVPPGFYIYADANRMDQILINLISNGIKFSHRGFVRVYIEDSQSVDIIHVEDTGMGIPTHKINELFEPFGQLESQMKNIHGTGLGLPVTKQLIEAHDGTISVKSELDVGTTVTVKLPKAHAYVCPLENSHSNSEEGYQFESMNLRIAIVDDDPINRLYVGNLFEHCSVELSSFANGKDLVSELAEGTTYDLVICDVNMPIMSGKTLKEYIQTKSTLAGFIFMTSSPVTPELAKDLNAELIHILRKPVSKERLFAIIERAVTGSLLNVH